MAFRCPATSNLEVHHKDRSGSNNIGNAQVLCHSCHVNTPSYGARGRSPPDFTEATKQEALDNAGHQCECTRDNCH